MLSETPAQIERNTFPDGIVIYVPASAKEAYEEAWLYKVGLAGCFLKLSDNLLSFKINCIFGLICCRLPN